MSNSSNAVSKLRKSLEFLHELHHHERPDAAQIEALDRQLFILRTWQSQRLTETYSDFLHTPHYRSACRFFLEDVYAPKDFSQRDQDILQIYELMSQFLPDFLLGLVRNAAELNEMSNQLDLNLLGVLVNDLQMDDGITTEMYAEAYRICDNYDARKTQIELIVDIGHQVEWSTKLPFVSTTLRLARYPANRAGWGDLHTFLENGFKSFKRMRKPRVFIDAIQEREMQILDNIFNSHPDPFAVV